VRQHDIDAVDRQMQTLKSELDAAVATLDEHFEELKTAARRRLGRLFNRFKQLNGRSNDQLDQLVERAQQIVRGVGPQKLRDNQPLRKQVASELSAVQSVLDGYLVDRPRRNILRRPK
jgi:hypothetical protein